MATPKKLKSGRWTIQIEVAGKRESRSFVTKSEAVAWSIKRSEALREIKTNPAKAHTLLDALHRYAREVSPKKRGCEKELVRLKAFEKHPLPIGNSIGDVTKAHLIAWRDWLAGKTSAGTVIRYAGLLGSVFEYARTEWEWITVNPMREVKKPASPAHREVVISGVQLRKILRALGWTKTPCRTVSQAVGYAVLLALSSGMRCGEICAVAWSDVHADHVRLHTSKTGAPRDVPLTVTARRIIRLMQGFDPVKVIGVQSASIDALFRKAKKRAGIEGITFHDTRHTAATRLAQKIHALDLCRMFGWKNTSQALTYYNPSAADIAKRLG